MILGLILFAQLVAPYVGYGIKRDPHQVVLFRKNHPCPSTGKTTGACEGYVVDHYIPLCAGGSDDPNNMQWEAVGESYIKDNWERAICAFLKKKQ